MSRQLRILMLIHGHIGPNPSGPQIRGWELARALSEWHDVIVCCQNRDLELRDGIRLVPIERRRLVRQAIASDAVISTHVPPYLYPFLLARRTAAVADLYDPIDLELADLDGGAELSTYLRMALQGQRVHLRFGDAVTCAARTQRERLVAELSRLPSRPGPELALRVVPFGIPPPPVPSARKPIREAIPAIGAADRIVLWWGGLWRWFDPATALRVFERLAAERPEVKLVFTAGQVKGGNTAALSDVESTRALADSKGLLGRNVFFLDSWIPYEERASYLREADLGLTLHRATAEAPFAARARYMDYLWTGCACILGAGDEVADEFGAHGFATLVRSGEVQDVEAAILGLLDDPAALDAARAAAGPLAERYRWPVVSRPLIEALEQFAEQPAPGRFRPVPLGAELVRFYVLWASHHFAKRWSTARV